MNSYHTLCQGTSGCASMYEKEQKEFNAYHCSKYNDWFHKCCLKKCNISVPRQNATFVCTKCSIPATIPWQHHKFTNICTADNFLTIVLLQCNQNLQFISKIGNSEIEKSLKTVIMLMQKGSVKEGKSLILRTVQARLNFQYSNGKYDCYGSEHSSLLCLFSYVWKLRVKQKCMSSHCPQKNKPTICCQTSFTLPALYSSSKDIRETFPEDGDRCGYCGAQFDERPLDEAVYAVNDRTDFRAKCLKQVKFYECKGEFLIISATFATKKPWVVLLNIEALNLQQINKLSLTISLYNQKLQLGGCTINTGAHFTSIIMWHVGPIYMMVCSPLRHCVLFHITQI